MDVRRLVQEERADLAAFLATLTPQQWQAPTLCAQWRVRDVVAHVISYDHLDTRGLFTLAARAGFRPAQINATALARYDTRGPEQLLALLANTSSLKGYQRRWAAGSAWSRRSSTTKTSGARSDGGAAYRQNGCCPRYAPP